MTGIAVCGSLRRRITDSQQLAIASWTRVPDSSHDLAAIGSAVGQVTVTTAAAIAAEASQNGDRRPERAKKTAPPSHEG
jgi:hypothetical protein